MYHYSLHGPNTVSRRARRIARVNGAEGVRLKRPHEKGAGSLFQRYGVHVSLGLIAKQSAPATCSIDCFVHAGGAAARPEVSRAAEDRSEALPKA